MIQNNTQKSNIEEVSGGIATSGFSIEVNESMFSMLTSKVYNDPVLAVVREWSTNACDACIDAGKEVKFDVHLPTPEELTFYVRDYGTGLSPENILGLFSNLGASTKRNSNKFNGTLGIGRMAGLAVSSAFSVDSYYNGTLHSYVISIQNGVPVTMHLGDSPTQEPNGLKLSVAVERSDINVYKEKADALYKHFDNKPNLNKDVKVDLEIEFEGNSDWIIEKKNPNVYQHSNYVVMSQVAYEIPRNSAIDTRGFENVIFRAEPGKVTFNPGRESLSLDKPTIKYVNERFKEIQKEYKEIIEDVFVLCDSDKELNDKYKAAIENVPNSLRKTIDPTSYFSDAFKALIKNSTQNYYGMYIYLSPETSADFIQATSGSVQLSYKESYNKNSKVICDTNTIESDRFFKASHVIIDVKTKFRSALNAKYKGQSYISWSRVVNTDIDDAVEESKKYLDSLGIEYVLASDLIKEMPKEEVVKESRAGLYASRVDTMGAAVLKSTKLTEYENDDFLYLKVSGSTPELSDDSYSFEEYLTAYNCLKTVMDMPEIRGVPKKYQGFVNDLDNWKDFETYIKDKAANAIFKQRSEGVKLLQNHRAISDKWIGKYPEEIQRYYNHLQRYKKYTNEKDCIHSTNIELMKRLGSEFKEYTPAVPIDVDKIKKMFPTTIKVLEEYWHDVEDNDLISTLAKLEKHHAIYSSK